MSVISRKREELERFVKKPYQPAAVDEWLDLIEYARHLEETCEQLKKDLEHADEMWRKLDRFIEKSPELKLGQAVAEYVRSTTLNEDAVKRTVKTEVKQHLTVDVDSEWEPYSGQREHRHKVTVDWN